MAKQRVMEEKEKMNPFLWFLFAIVIPVIIAITLTAIVLAMAGVNVVDWAKNTGNNIPVISSFITTDEEASQIKEEEDIQSRFDKKDAEIDELTQEKLTLENTIEQLEQKIAKLERDLDVATNQSEKDESSETINQISSSFKEMKNKQAASILEQLDTGAAFIILSDMTSEDRGLIMENMDPEKAAEITKRFINQ
ncbi:MotE family protein [Ornithinibacillus sp. 179-J 7C1 HS]|uniref:MotE family protein n=1 Tax=Ornithinibacillus sp. 179-J 7C1 HS TaxID=3142384 RepID=UPI0039A3E18D